MRKNNVKTKSVMLVATAGVVLQILILFVILPEPSKLSWPDPNHYYNIARTLYDGGPYSTAENARNLYRSPGYPFILSLAMHIAGTSIIGIRLFHIALFPFFLITLYKLGEKLFGHRTGILTMLLCVLYPIYLYVPLTLYPESLLIYIFAAIALFLLYARENLSTTILILLGAFICLAVMIRPTAVVWIPVAFFYLGWKSNLRPMTYVKLVVVLVVLPAACVFSWMQRNYSVHGCRVFTTAGSVNLLNSYNENSTWKNKSNFVDPTGEFERKLSQKETLAEREDLRMFEVRKFIMNNPGKALKLVFMRCLDLWNPIPRTTTRDGAARLKFKIVNAATFLPLVILGLSGFAINLRSLFTKSLLALVVLNTAINGIAAVSIRYRAVTDFALILMAAFVLNFVLDKCKIWRG